MKGSETCLLALPDSILHSIISQWLDVLDINKLDSAVCSTKFRDNFLDILPLTDHVQPLRSTFAAKVFLQDLFTWLDKRGLVMTHVTFCSNEYPTRHFEDVFAKQLDDLLDITYHNKFTDQYSWLHRVLNSSANLQCLTMYDEKLTFSLVTTIKLRCPHLHTFKWINKTDKSFNVEELSALVTGLPKLRELVLIKFILPQGVLEKCILTVQKVMLVTRVNQPGHTIPGTSSFFLGQVYQDSGVNIVYRGWHAGYTSTECFNMLADQTWFTPITSLVIADCTGVEAILNPQSLSTVCKPNVTLTNCSALTQATLHALIKCPYIKHLTLQHNTSSILNFNLGEASDRGITSLTVIDFKCYDGYLMSLD